MPRLIDNVDNLLAAKRIIPTAAKSLKELHERCQQRCITSNQLKLREQSDALSVEHWQEIDEAILILSAGYRHRLATLINTYLQEISSLLRRGEARKRSLRLLKSEQYRLLISCHLLRGYGLGLVHLRKNAPKIKRRPRDVWHHTPRVILPRSQLGHTWRLKRDRAIKGDLRKKVSLSDPNVGGSGGELSLNCPDVWPSLQKQCWIAKGNWPCERRKWRLWAQQSYQLLRLFPRKNSNSIDRRFFLSLQRRDGRHSVHVLRAGSDNIEFCGLPTLEERFGDFNYLLLSACILL
jgi:hypothetical protein